jgi:hypothetical protein
LTELPSKGILGSPIHPVGTYGLGTRHILTCYAARRQSHYVTMPEVPR